MNIEQMNRGKELLELIKITENALNKLKSRKFRESTDGKFYEDRVYGMHISEWRDGSDGAELARYYGNERLLNVIIAELETQLAEFQEKFDSL
jgi:hypothetical protein